MKILKNLLVCTGLMASLNGCQSLNQNTLETKVDVNNDSEKPTISQTISHDCYLQLSIKERRVGNKTIFSLKEASSKKGNYQHLVRINYPLEPSQFTLETYDSSSNLLSIYALHGSRFIIMEDFSGNKPKGEIIELEENQITTTINYDPKIEKIKVNNGCEKIDLNIDPKSLECK